MGRSENQTIYDGILIRGRSRRIRWKNVLIYFVLFSGSFFYGVRNKFFMVIRVMLHATCSLHDMNVPQDYLDGEEAYKLQFLPIPNNWRSLSQTSYQREEVN